MKKSFAIICLIVSAIISFSFVQQKFDLKASIARGQEVYTIQCLSCHQEQGEGIADVYPPLAKSDYLLADQKRSIHQILNGVSGEIKVNGKVYNSEMAALDLTDQEVSDVLNYVRNSWGNKGAAITAEAVKASRK
jgi:mono/diheme cytochrome c family protein